MLAVIFTIAFIICFLSYALHTYTHLLEHKGKFVPAILGKYFHTIVHIGYFAWIIMLFSDPVRFNAPLYVREIGVIIGTIGLYLMLESMRKRKSSGTGNLITTGVYSMFRHPMYVGMTLIMTGYPLSIGSLLTLLSAILWVSQMIIWTYWEEKELF
ncbi:MAG: methyltransferase [bacterium]